MTAFARLALCALLLAGLASRPLLVAVHADAPAGPRTVPDVVGLTQAEAERMLKDASFEVAIEEVPSSTAKAGTVVSQDPGGRTTREAGSKVTLKVAVAAAAPAPAEPEPAPAAPAEPAAPSAPEQPAAPSEPAPAPPALELTPAPALADLAQEAGPNADGAAVPSALGLSLKEARELLAGWEIVTEVAMAAPELRGRVVEQVPLPGSTLAAGQPITLTFGLADAPDSDYVAVPQVEGLPLAEAHEAIQRAGFVPSYASVPSLEAQAGLVTSTQPRRNAYLLKGETLRVRVGRGGLAPPPEPAPAPVEPAPVEPTPEPAPAPVEPAPAEPVVPVEPPAPIEPPPPPPPPPPGTSTLVSPVAGDSFPKAYGPSFEWAAVADADAYEWEVEAETTDNAWRAVRTERVTTSRFRPSPLDAGRYRWRVRALRGDIPGEWTDWRRLFLY